MKKSLLVLSMLSAFAFLLTLTGCPSGPSVPDFTVSDSEATESATSIVLSDGSWRARVITAANNQETDIYAEFTAKDNTVEKVTYAVVANGEDIEEASADDLEEVKEAIESIISSLNTAATIKTNSDKTRYKATISSTIGSVTAYLAKN